MSPISYFIVVYIVFVCVLLMHTSVYIVGSI